MASNPSKHFYRAGTKPVQKKTDADALASRYQPVYDNAFDDLIEKLNKIDFKKGN